MVPGPTLTARLLEALKHMLYAPRFGMMMRHYDPDTSLISSTLTAATVRSIGSLATDFLNRNGKKLAIKRSPTAGNRAPSFAGSLLRVATVKLARALARVLERVLRLWRSRRRVD